VSIESTLIILKEANKRFNVIKEICIKQNILCNNTIEKIKELKKEIKDRDYLIECLLRNDGSGKSALSLYLARNLDRGYKNLTTTQCKMLLYDSIKKAQGGIFNHSEACLEHNIDKELPECICEENEN